MKQEMTGSYFQELGRQFFRTAEDENGDQQIVCPSCEALDTIQLTQTGHECARCLWHD